MCTVILRVVILLQDLHSAYTFSNWCVVFYLSVVEISLSRGVVWHRYERLAPNFVSLMKQQ